MQIVSPTNKHIKPDGTNKCSNIGSYIYLDKSPGGLILNH